MKQQIKYLAKTQLGCLLYMLIIAMLLFVNSTAIAQDEESNAGAEYAYIAVEPDIVTNYVGDNSARLGYLRVTIEIMLVEPEHIPNLEHHMPLLRATVIEILGAQPDSKVRSLTGREEIRRSILKSFKDLMLRETGNEIVRDVIFTRYLRQGG